MNKNNKLGLILSLLISVGSTSALAGIDDELKNQGYRMLICNKYICIYRLIDDIVYVYHIAFGAIEYPKLFEKNVNDPRGSLRNNKIFF